MKWNDAWLSNMDRDGDGKLANKPATAEMYKKQFCLGNNTRCARFLISKALGKEKVPLTFTQTR